MDLENKKKFKDLYEKMFYASQTGRLDEADHFRTLMEDHRLSRISDRNLIPSNLNTLPTFVQLTLNKTQEDLGVHEASNCINAAFNYHNETPIFLPFTPIDFLKRIHDEFDQVDSAHTLKIGDLVVFWSRIDDQWKDQKIVVAKLKPESPGFPFGLVFDHVAVYVGANKLFHKPDPTLSSRYQINEWDDVIGFSEVLRGFELTFHRRRF